MRIINLDYMVHLMSRFIIFIKSIHLMVLSSFVKKAKIFLDRKSTISKDSKSRQPWLEI